MPWGVPVPGDDTQVMYVWFDALTNYISTLGWPKDRENFEKFWGTKETPNAIQIAGKDNLRQQSAMWQAMLMAADLPTSKQIFINGFIGVDGQKMSKSIGNVIAPNEMVEKYGVDGTRYLLLTKGNFGEDNDISWEKLDAKYNADLANGLGNLTSRIVTLAGDIEYNAPDVDIALLQKELESMALNTALEKVWQIVRDANKYIEETKPWELRKENKKEFEKTMQKLLVDLHKIAILSQPFLPETSQIILNALENRERVILFDRI
jgi:methionyl-tRNA synthetase